MLNRLLIPICTALLVGVTAMQMFGVPQFGASAQTFTVPPAYAVVVATCGGGSYTAGNIQPLTQSTGGALCVNQ